MKSADLEALRTKATDNVDSTVTVDAAVLLELLSHIDELRTDLRNIDEFHRPQRTRRRGLQPSRMGLEQHRRRVPRDTEAQWRGP